MGEGVSSDNIMEGSQPDALTDLDSIDDFLSEGFWLQKTDGSETIAPSPFTTNILYDPSLCWASFEETEALDDPSKGVGDNKQKALSHENPNYIFYGNSINASCSLVPSMDCSIEASGLCRRWWIGPTMASTSSMDRLIRALSCIKDCLSDRDVLIQVWVPVHNGNKRVLTTNHQPFLLDLNCARLAGYRDASVNYKFTAEEGEEEFRGLPGRVFASKIPEWTPDVQFFRKDEYLRIGHAQQHNVHGTLGVPVFELRDHNCLGVIEVVFITRKIKYHLELESVCKALEAVDLRCSSSCSIQNVKAYDYSYQTALPKITEILRAVSEKHSLPLAQAWASCTRHRKEGRRHTNENLIHCVSPVDSVCFIGNPSVQGFHEACSEHHLFKGQGIVGRAFVTNQLCFSPDVTSFTKTEYPLSHYARIFGLHAAVAIPMQNACADSTDFVLELFLPVDCNDPKEHRKMITSLYAVIQNVSWSVCDISYRELTEKPIVPVVVSEKMPETEGFLSHDSLKEAMNDVNKASKGENRKLLKSFARKSPESRPNHTTVAVSREKRRAKTEKAVTLEILQQYFAGSLKDAAKSIGVCPTTLKRICREYGIKRWPSRKFKKVSHSIRKIQRVIDYVQGQSGTLPVESFYCNFPELAFPYLSKLQPPDPSKPLQISAVDIVSKSSTSSSSCTQNTNSREPSLLAATEPGPLNIDDSWQQHLSSIEEGPKVLESTNNVSRGYRLKVTYGEEKIRFRMQSQWCYGDLMREIGRRFGIIDTNGFVIKYMDDDLEWVLLTCDDDLKECIVVFQSSGNQILRLSFDRDSP